MPRSPEPPELPYRACVGIMVLNRAGRVFIGRRRDGPEHVDADPCLADAAGRRRSGRGHLAGGAARALRGDQYPLGRASRRDRGLADLRHSERHHRGRLGRQVSRPDAEMVRACASSATSARSTSRIPAAAITSRSSLAWRWEPIANLPALVVPFKRKVYEQVVAAFSRFADARTVARIRFRGRPPNSQAFKHRARRRRHPGTGARSAWGGFIEPSPDCHLRATAAAFNRRRQVLARIIPLEN